MKVVLKTLKLLSVVCAAVFVTGCSTSPTEGIVSVIDLATSAPVAGASVKIYVDQTNNAGAGFYVCNESDLTPQLILTTSDAGVTEKVCFKLPAVLKVEVSTPGGKSGTTTLSLVEQETTTAVCKVSN